MSEWQVILLQVVIQGPRLFHFLAGPSWRCVFHVAVYLQQAGGVGENTGRHEVVYKPAQEMVSCLSVRMFIG